MGSLLLDLRKATRVRNGIKRTAKYTKDAKRVYELNYISLFSSGFSQLLCVPFGPLSYPPFTPSTPVPDFSFLPSGPPFP